MDTIIIIAIYVLIYIVFMQVKTLRDYIMEYEGGHPHRWNNSIWKNKAPVWFQAYLLNDGDAFYATAPKLLIKLLWSEKENGFRVGVDGWHQLDGIIFILPHSFIVALIGLLLGIPWYWLVLWAVATPFVPWYALFNVLYHILNMKTNKQWFRVKWLAWLLGKKTER